MKHVGVNLTSAIVFVWVSFIALPAVAVMGQLSGASYVPPSYETVPKSDTIVATFTIDPATQVEPYPGVYTFHNTSTGDSPPDVDTWQWDFGDGSSKIDTVRPVTFQHTYNYFGKWKATLKLKQGNTIVAVTDTPVEAPPVYLFNSLTQSQLQPLATVQSLAGLRDLIARHPTRSRFLIGTAEFDGFWYGPPPMNDTLPPLGEKRYSREFWKEPGPYPTTYFNPDTAKENYIDYGHVPLDVSAIRDYIAHDFNLLFTCLSAMPQSTARLAVLGDDHKYHPSIGSSVVGPNYFYDYNDGLLAIARDHGMSAYAESIIYTVPAWLAFGSMTLRPPYSDNDPALITPSDFAGYLKNIVYHMVSHAPAGQSNYHPFDLWNVTAEVVADPLDSHNAIQTASQDPLDDIVRGSTNAGWMESLWPWNFLGPGPVAVCPDAGDYCYDYWWPFHVLAGAPCLANPNIKAATFRELYTEAKRAVDDYPGNTNGSYNPKLTYEEYRCDFRYSGKVNGQPVDQAKYARLRSLIDDFRTHTPDPIPLDIVGLEMHVAAWECMAYDSQSHELRLSPSQLESIRDAVVGIAEKGVQVMLSQMDVRSGQPSSQENNAEFQSVYQHLGYAGRQTWYNSPTGSVSQRQEWQGRVYEAILNAALYVPECVGVNFWDIFDYTNWCDRKPENDWPNTPIYPASGNSQAALFGDDPSTSEAEFFYPKPAYFGVRNAIINYFGEAFVVKGPSGEELVRFAENGNVLLIKMPAQNDNRRWYEHVHVNGQGLATLDLSGGGNFIVKRVDGTVVAAVVPEGDLYLKGQIKPYQTQFDTSGPTFSIKDKNGQIVSQIDQGGNLVMSGALTVQGVPYVVRLQGTDYVATGQNDPYVADWFTWTPQ